MGLHFSPKNKKSKDDTMKVSSKHTSSTVASDDDASVTSRTNDNESFGFVNLPSLQESTNELTTATPTLNLKDVNFLKILGEGQFGQVWLATNTNTDQTAATAEPMAVKVLSKFNLVESGDKSIVQNLIHEVEILREIHGEYDVHPCLVQMMEAIQDDNLVYIFQEFCSGGELFSLLHNDEISVRAIPNAVQFYTACIADALHYLHQRGIIYRDLKPENIMIRPTNGYPVLIDFGYAKHIKKPRMESRTRRSSTRNDRESKVFDLITFFEDNNDDIAKRNSVHARRSSVVQAKRSSLVHARRSSLVAFQENMMESTSESTKHSVRFSACSSSPRRVSRRTSTTSYYTCKDDGTDGASHSMLFDSFHNDDDFNDSVYLDAEQYPDKCYSMVGTPKYVAPEIILGEGYDYRADLWALGVVVYEMLASYNPMIGPNDIDNGTDTTELYRCITEEDYVPLPNDIASRESQAANLIDMLLQRTPSERIKSSSDVLQHSWFSNIDFYELRLQGISAPWVPFKDNNNDNNLDTKHFDDWTDIANDPDKCVFKSSYPKLKKKEIALFANETAFRRQ